MIGAALTPRLSRLFGRRTLMNAGFALALVTSVPIYWLGPGDIAVLFVLGGLTEFATGPIVALFFAMLGDAADFAEWKQHRRMTGLVYSAGTLSIKFGTGVAGALTGWLLTMFGYVANVTQTHESLQGIQLLISILPACAALLAIIAFHFYPLDDRLLARIQKELMERKGITA
jgi:GPH family glycoside/pentoside/hexuronide:cation symporter